MHKGQNNPPPPCVIGVTGKEFPSGPALVEFRGTWEGWGGGGIIEKEKDKILARKFENYVNAEC